MGNQIMRKTKTKQKRNKKSQTELCEFSIQFFLENSTTISEKILGKSIQNFRKLNTIIIEYVKINIP